MGKSKPVELTQSQMGIYLECVGREEGLCYHIPLLYVFDLTLDTDRLCRAIETAIKAHPVLFTRLSLSEEGTPLQSIEEEPLTVVTERIESQDFTRFIEPFQLIGGRLFHVHLLKDDAHIYLIWDCHHLISDGTSLSVMLHDIETAYNGGTIDAEAMTLADVAEREKALRASPAHEEGRRWFAENFDCGDLRSDLMPDQDLDSQQEAALRFDTSKNCVERPIDIDVEQIKAFCRENGIYRATLMTTAYAYLLARFNNEQAALTRTVNNGRADKRLSHTQGMFVRTMPVYCRFDDSTTVLELLQRQQEQMAGCIAHEAYSYMDLMNDLKLQTTSSFIWHGELFADSELMGSKMEAVPLLTAREGDRIYTKAYLLKGQVWLRTEFGSEYSKALIETFVDGYEAVLRGMLTEQRLCDIRLTNERQLARLDQFNETETPIDLSETVVSAFQKMVALQPDKTAVVFKDRQYTYKEVDDWSNRIAAFLLSKGVQREDVVSILIPRCEWMVIASLGVLKAGCAYQPLDPSYPKERLRFMMEDAKAKWLIADEQLQSLVDEYDGGVLLTKELADLPDPLTPISSLPSPRELFILLYTSGSTGTPKGVMLEHRNIMAFCRTHLQTIHIESDSRIGAYASFGFDASLMELWPALIIGATVYIFPEEMRLDLITLNDYFEENHITHGFMTTQVGRQFVNNIDNHSLRGFITGGEKLSDVTPPPYLLVNGYGPTESVCYVTAFEVREKLSRIPIGKATPNIHLYVVDRYGQRQPTGAVGELWVSGPQVARGYLNLPEKTAEAFICNPWNHAPGYYEKCYRTGDVVRYLTDGNIEFVGRRDGQVKIRGFRIELKEVETIIRQYPGVKDVTVQAFDEEGGGQYIAAFIVGDDPIDIEALHAFIAQEKPPYMVPAVTMQIAEIPLNQNQKVDKRALPKPVKRTATSTSSGQNAPLNVLEKELKQMIAAIVGNEDFDVTTVLGYAGLTSIMAIKLAVQVNKRFGITLDSKSLVKNGTLQSIENEILNHYLGARDKEQGEDNRRQETRASAPLAAYPLSYAQTGVYVECIKQPLSTIYNIPTKITFPQGTDTDKLEEAVKAVVKHHPQLTVCFDMDNGLIVQKTRTDQPVEVSTSRMSETELERYKHEFVKPFNLRKGPLYRLEIVQTERQVCLLMDVHHLVADGASIDLMLNQLCALLNGQSVEPEQYSYAQHVADQKTAEGGPDYLAAKAFFAQQLSECEEVTEVPSDLTNPVSQGMAATVSCPFDLEATERFCREHKITPAALTLAAVYYTLSRYTNNERVTLATISNGRSDLRTADTVGMFVNTLMLSAKIEAQPVINFLRSVSDQLNATLEHENYPFAQIAADYDLSAEIMFAYQVGVLNRYAIGDKELEMENLELNVPKFRIAFYIQEHEGKPSVTIDYDNGRYSEGLMQSMADAVATAIQAFQQHPETSLLQISLLNQAQLEVLNRFNQTDVPFDDTQTIVSLFRHQAELHPDNIAVVYHDKRYTYREVDEISDRIANYILSKGLQKEETVSILIPRSEWMVIASMGVLKAGCAYQPLDPSYPSERLNFMMRDADAKLLIADEELRPLVNEYEGEVLLTKDVTSLPADSISHPLLLASQPSPQNLFILLYTSGSTGMPKGVMLEHRNLVAFCHWYQRYYQLDATGRVAAYASYGFDASMMDVYPALTCGATVYIIGEDIRLDLPGVNDYFNREGITHSFITTQVGYQFATNVANHSLRHFSVGGEKLSALQPPTSYQMHNGYGPTECTIFTTTYPLKTYEQDIPIGKPVDNVKLFIVDKDGNRLPLGAMGELWISGAQVGRGYLNRPEKTAETFIASPFPASQAPFDRCYRTGDIVRYLSDGNIQFVGRRDGQVKIRGFRIELKEVEAVIREYPGVKDATVQAFEYENGGKYIAAYVVGDGPIDVKELHRFIGKKKPSYMVPATTMQIDRIPLNQNQKVNRKALPMPVIQTADETYVAPVGELETFFCQTFGNILGMEHYSATSSFFEQGGTSIMVTRVIIEADKGGHHIAYGDVFAHPTPRLLAAFLNEGDPDVQASAAHADAQFDYAPIDGLLTGNTIDSFRQGDRQPIGRVLLTGSTGYLGIHILKELIDREDVPAIYCLVRADDAEKGEHRLKRLLFYYYGRNYKELFGTRLHVVLGDVTAPIAVAGEIDTVFNCAAVVKHFSNGTEIEDVNIGGAKHCVDFCMEQGARLVHISTYSTAGLSVDGTPKPDVVQTEQRLYYGQYMDNRYVHSKFIAERLVLEAAALHRLNAKVMRVGNLAPRSTDGEFQINAQTNAAMGRVRVFKTLGCYPYEMADMPMEFSPINEVARAIVLLAETPRACCLFHPFNNHHVHFGDVLEELRLIGDAPRQVETSAYEQALTQAKADPVKAQQLQSLIAYQDMAHGKQATAIRTTNDYTTQVLYRLGFRWSSTSWDYVDRFLTAIDGLGFFDN